MPPAADPVPRGTAPGRIPGAFGNAVATTGLVAVIVAASLLIGQSLLAVLRYRDVFPYYDMILVDYRYFTPPIRDFWIFHDNEHLPLFAMPLFWADLRLFGAQGTFLVLCNIAFATGIAVAPRRAIVAATRGRPVLAMATIAMIGLAMLWLQNRANLAWPKQTHMYLCSLALAFAFRQAAAPRPVDFSRALAICSCLFVATFSFGYGIIGFVPVALLAALRRWRPGPALTLPCVFAASLLLFLWLGGGLGAARETAPLLSHPANALAGIILYALTFVAAPVILACSTNMLFGHAEWIGWIAASTGLAILASRVLRATRHVPDELDAWFILLGLFTLGNALETAIVRSVAFGLHGAIEYRYVLGELPFWIGLGLLGTRALASAPWPSLVLAAAACLALEYGISLSQHVERINLRTISAMRWQAAMAALDHVDDRALFGNDIWINAQQVEAVIAGLDAHRWSVFAWKQAGWIGRRLDGFGAVATGCDGTLRTMAPVAGSTALLVDGWASAPKRATGSAWILLSGAAGTVIGLAHDGTKNDALMRTRPDLSLLFSGWRGYVPGPVDPAGLRAWLVLPDHRVCRLASSLGAAP